MYVCVSVCVGVYDVTVAFRHTQ